MQLSAIGADGQGERNEGQGDEDDEVTVPNHGGATATHTTAARIYRDATCGASRAMPPTID